MSSKKISVVLFDYGGVLADEGFRGGLAALAKEQDLDAAAMPAEGMKAVYDSGFVLGRGTAADFWALMRERTGLQGDDDVLTDRILSGFVIRPWMIERVQQLHEQGIAITCVKENKLHHCLLMWQRNWAWHLVRYFLLMIMRAM